MVILFIYTATNVTTFVTFGDWTPKWDIWNSEWVYVLRCGIEIYERTLICIYTHTKSLKREEIKKRDKYLCQVCLKYGRFIYQDVQVHHIIPINKDYDKRLDSNNLITLCTLHHKDAERGFISVEELHSLIDSPPRVDD